MRYTKISITIPDEIYKEAKELVTKRQIKFSRLVANVLADEVRKNKEELFVRRINKIFDDPEIAKEQRSMARDIADNTNVEELPW